MFQNGAVSDLSSVIMSELHGVCWAISGMLWIVCSFTWCVAGLHRMRLDGRTYQSSWTIEIQHTLCWLLIQTCSGCWLFAEGSKTNITYLFRAYRL